MRPKSLPAPSVNGRPPNPDPLIANFDELNALWKQAEEKIAAMRVPVNVKVKIRSYYCGDDPENPDSMTTEYLCWHKLPKDWRLCFGEKCEHLYDDRYSSWDATPIAECPMDVRVKLAPEYAKLKTAVESARQNYIPQVGAAIASLKQALGASLTLAALLEDL